MCEERGTRGVSLTLLEVRSVLGCGHYVKMEFYEMGAGVAGGVVGMILDIAAQPRVQFVGGWPGCNGVAGRIELQGEQSTRLKPG